MAQTMNPRKEHTGTKQPVETFYKMVTVWFEKDQDDFDKHAPVKADEVDWYFPKDRVKFYRVEE